MKSELEFLFEIDNLLNRTRGKSYLEISSNLKEDRDTAKNMVEERIKQLTQEEEE